MHHRALCIVVSAVAFSAATPVLLAQQTPATPPSDEAGDPLQMQEVVVTGTASRERTKFESSVGISTFSAAEIEQQAPLSTADLISAVPGFWVESTAGTTQGNVFARGIIQDGGYKYVALMEDGLPLYPVSELSFYNPDQFVRIDETIARVEAVRGGTAPIFTPGAVGGTINFVTRSPRDEPEGIFKVTFGDYSFYRGDAYWSAPINENWGFAVGGYYRQSDGIRDPGYTADKGGQIRAKLTRSFESGDLELFAKYINDRSLFIVPIPLQGDPSDPDGIAGADPGEYALQSEDLARAGLPPSAAEHGLQGSDLEDGIHPDIVTAGGRITWTLTDAITLTNTLRWTDGDVRFDGIFSGEAPVTGVEFAAAAGVAPDFTVLNSGAPYDPNQLVQNHGHWVVAKDYEAFQNDARVNFAIQQHELAVGVYFADYSMSDRWSLGNLLLMDVSNRPNRLLLPGVTDPNGFTQYSFDNLAADHDATAWSVYASDEWRVTDALRLDFGIRFDREDIDSTISDGITVDLDGDPATPWDNETALAGPSRTRSEHDFHNTGWSVGFNYQLNEQHAFFGHYTDAARLPHFDDIRGGSLRKDNVTNIELGYKTLFGPLALFATLFQTEFDNVFFNDILADGSQARRSAETRTRGLEIEGVYQPLDVFNISFSLTVQNPEYRDFIVRDAQTGTETNLSGNQIRRIPENMVRLTPVFLFAGNRGRVYATWSWFDRRFSNDENTVVLPSYNKLDAGVIYDLNDQLTLQIVGDNLTDEVGLTEGNPRTDPGATGVGTVFMARPLLGRSVQAAATWRF